MTTCDCVYYIPTMEWESDTTATHLCWSEEAYSVKMFHSLSSSVADQFKEIDLLLKYLGLRVHHTHNADL